MGGSHAYTAESNITDRPGGGLPTVYLDADAKATAGALSMCNTGLLPGNVWAGTATRTGQNPKCGEYGDDPIQMSLQVLTSDFAGNVGFQGSTNYGAATAAGAEYACTVTSKYSMALYPTGEYVDQNKTDSSPVDAVCLFTRLGKQ